MASAPKPHVVIFPYMAQGHTIPLLDLSKALTLRGLKVTIITTPSNALSLSSKISQYPSISLSVLPFPKVQNLPEKCENTADLPSMDLWVSFAMSTRSLKPSFESLLKDMAQNGCRPICVISDFFLCWTLDTCRLFGVPRIVFHGMGVLSMLVAKIADMHGPCIMGSSYLDPIQLPELRNIPFTVHRTDLPYLPGAMDPTQPLTELLLESGYGDVNSWGVIVNSFEDLEGDYVAAFESFYCNGAKAWCLGPALLYDPVESDKDNQSYPYVKWLDKQGTMAVIYVSFGTQSHVSDMQMDELALGLEMAGHPFIWVIKSSTWISPDGWEERVKERGLIARNWVEQRCILAHPSIGGFLSHMGWNSVIESLSNGVPFLAWPIGNDQPLNAKFVVDVLGAGIWVPQTSVTEKRIMTVGRDLICDGVKELMGGEKGRKARETAQVLKRRSMQAVKKGGSSDKKLDELIECLTHQGNGIG